MSDKLLKKRYYRITFSLTSPLSVGCGKNENSDKDIVVNSLGKPYIPASALAGIYRSLFEEDKAKKYFGEVKINRSKEKQEKITATESRIIVYDANVLQDHYHISVRDCVGLDEWKTAVKGAKFDFEILEPGSEFVTYLEENLYDGEAGTVLIADAWEKGKIVLGSKNSRGMGRCRLKEIKQKEFIFTDEKEIDKWLGFDLYNEKYWQGECLWEPEKERELICELQKQNPFLTLKIGLAQDGPLTIRRYTTETKSEKYKGNTPDYEQLVYIRDNKNIPVIPGTSWAGAFKHHMSRLNRNVLEDYFGMKSGNGKQGEGKKSDITFGESEVQGAKEKIVTRNAIDRFTGGAVDGALFTEKMFYGGTTCLEISFHKKCSFEFRKILAAAIADLNMGILSIGGETSVGHGLFRVTSVTLEGKQLTNSFVESDLLYVMLTKAFTGEGA